MALLHAETTAMDRATWVMRAKREAVRRHGDRWGIAHDRTTIKLLFRWDILSREERDAACLLYTSPSPRDRQKSRMPSSA